MEQETQRNTVDIVQELEAEGEKFVEVCLVVILFERGSQLIFNNDGTTAEKLEKLHTLLRQGGQPIGFIGYTCIANEYTIWSRVLREYASDEAARDCLHKLSELTEERLKKIPGAIVSKKEGCQVN